MDYDSDEDYIVELESDQEEVADSSDDEIDIVLNGTPKQRRKLEKQIRAGPASQRIGSKGKRGQLAKEDEDSSEDEFEKEMRAELNATMTQLENKYKSASTDTSAETAGGAGPSGRQENQFYDNEYFDSDSDEEGSRQEKKDRKRPMLSNDDLLYDPEADDADQTWVDAQRRRYQPHAQRPTPRTSASDERPTKTRKLPSSDAVLNCPACMTQLCLDCQRHEKYQNQYRAMFVTNCAVDYTQKLKFPKQHQQQQQRKSKKKKWRNRPGSDGQTEEDQNKEEEPESFNPVKCTECNTEVAVFDADEVFHFFNVLASHS